MTREERTNKLLEEEKELEKLERLKKRKKHLIVIAIILFIFIFSLIYYMRFIETKKLEVKEVTITSNKLPKSFHGLKIVQLSDIHYKFTTEISDIKKIVKEVNLLKPDIVVLTGDLYERHITYTDNDLNLLKEELDKINTTIGKYYIKGNHDYKFKDFDIGFINLTNTSDLIYINDADFIKIKGYGSSIKNDFFINNEDNDCYTITLIHEGDNASKVKDSNLILAGHSHNMQINIPFISELFKVEGAKKYYRFHYKVNNTNLYVSSGIGTSNKRLRFNNPPTINLYRLRSK